MRNLLLSSCILLLFCACKLGHYNRLISVSDKTDDFKSVFDDHFHSFLFKTNLSIYHKDFSGLLVTKQMQPGDYRVIFTTELGMKLFDFEFKDTAFILHYCVPQFNRPALLKIIQQDMQLLLVPYPPSASLSRYKDSQNKYDICKVTQGAVYSNYYFREKSSKHLVKIEHAKRNVKKTTFVLDQYSEEDVPGHLLIQHHDIHLKITLTLLKK
jgi:hypothetical protein